MKIELKHENISNGNEMIKCYIDDNIAQCWSVTYRGYDEAIKEAREYVAGIKKTEPKEIHLQTINDYDIIDEHDKQGRMWIIVKNNNVFEKCFLYDDKNRDEKIQCAVDYAKNCIKVVPFSKIIEVINL